MKKIIAYKIIEGKACDIELAVYDLIEEKNGWEPHGSMCSYTDDKGQLWFVREMVQVKYSVHGMQDRPYRNRD